MENPYSSLLYLLFLSKGCSIPAMAEVDRVRVLYGEDKPHFYI
jgi:hypothetical protein